MKQRLIHPGFDLNQEYANPQEENIPHNIELIADKIELGFMEATNIKAVITDKNSNPVPNAKVSWSTSEKSDIGAVITDNNGVATKRILKTMLYDIIITAKCNDISSSITLKKEYKKY